MKIDFKFVPSKINTKDNLDKSIYFMHIPKCGGTTIDHIFVKLFSILKNYNFKRFKYSKEIKKNKFSGNEIDYSKRHFISGHLDYDFCNNLKNIYKCSVVREPISRVISHYKFMVFRLNTTPEKYPFKIFINEEVRKNRDNLITRHFSGSLNEKKEITDEDCLEAISNTKSFDSIYTLENWDKFLSEILSLFGFPSILYSRFQEHKYNFFYSPKKEDINLINQYYYYDFIIYGKITKFKNNFKFNKDDKYNKNICIISPYYKTDDRLYKEQDIKKLFVK